MPAKKQKRQKESNKPVLVVPAKIDKLKESGLFIPPYGAWVTN